MKVKEFKQEIANSEVLQLSEKLSELRRSLFMLHLSKKTSHAKDSSQFKKLRRNIARVLTVMGR